MAKAKSNGNTNQSEAGVTSGVITEETKTTSENAPGITKPNASGKIEVDIEFLNRLQAQVEEFKKVSEKLMAVADKNRLATYDARHSTEVLKTAKMSFYEGKAVVGWRTVKDEVYVDGRSVYHETQIIELIFNDGTRAEMNLLDRARRVEKKTGEIIKRWKDAEDHEIITLQLSDGQQFTLDANFLN